MYSTIRTNDVIACPVACQQPGGIWFVSSCRILLIDFDCFYQPHFEHLKRFLDYPTSPYSIHNLVGESAAIFGVKKNISLMYDGEWFGPSRFSQLVESLINREPSSDMVVHVPFTNCIYIDKVLGLCQCRIPASSSEKHVDNSLSSINTIDTDNWKPLWMLIPTLLGTSNTINPIYFPHLKALLSCEYCTGIIAGKAKASLYILGYQGKPYRVSFLSMQKTTSHIWTRTFFKILYHIQQRLTRICLRYVRSRSLYLTCIDIYLLRAFSDLI